MLGHLSRWRDHTTFAALRLLFHGLARLPCQIRFVAAWCLTELRGAFSRKEGKILSQNIHTIFRLPAHSSFHQLFCRQVYHHQSVSFLEYMAFAVNPRCVQIEGLEELLKNMAALELGDKGAVLITAHLGGWEFLPYFCSKTTRPFIALAKQSRYPALNRLTLWMRMRLGTRILWADQKQILRQMLKTLQRGHWLGFVMDQKPKGRKGPRCEFFGLDTEFVSGPAAMASRFDCGVLAAYCTREGPFHYRIHSKPLLSPGHGHKDLDLMTQMFAQDIESLIRLYPEQWCWNYKRWVKN